jgi:porphobilinogen synthase
MNTSPPYLPVRLRRLRRTPELRALVQETTLNVKNLILPLFICAGENICNPISSMPGHFQLSVDQLADEVKHISSLGIPAVLLFGIPASKDSLGQDAYRDDGVIQQAIRVIKQAAPHLIVMADVCFCEYTDHGHCGIVNDNTGHIDVDNDATLEILALQAVSLALAGADVIAPSGMMDGMVATIRQALDSAEFQHIPILSYAVKYASSFYGPFRNAAGYSLQFGDRSTYQMNPANGAEALREAELDVAEGADMLMVKPALHYLDVIYRVKQQFPEIPLAAYHVSGEYAMIKVAAAQGLIDEQRAVMETLLSIKRAGADMIITYYAKTVAGWLNVHK